MKRAGVIPGAAIAAMVRDPISALILAALLLPGCATRSSSDIEWERSQCGQIIDRDAREKCLERVGRR